MGKGKLLLELRMLKLADEQTKLRAAVEKEEEDVQLMNERNYRKFVRNCLRQRIEIIKQVLRFANCVGQSHCHKCWLNLDPASSPLTSQRVIIRTKCCA